ncbi:MAG: hypothetical protein H7228_02885 [Polaromonas sp.]|nr:hypothetical protein [Polaromonas sp.]
MAATPAPRATHGLVLLANGQLAGWGANEFAQVQAGKAAFLTSPVRMRLVGARLVAVAVGRRHSLALDDTGKVVAWGDNSSGQLGLGHTRPVAGPTVVAGLPSPAFMVAAGTQHSAALLADGSVWVWGANNHGQMATGMLEAFAVQAKPARVAGLSSVFELAAGDDFVVALVGKRDKTGAAKGTAWIWGAGQTSPRAVDAIAGVTAIRASESEAMARTATGGYWRWRAGQVQPAFAQRQAFERLGEMTHPMLATLTAQVVTEMQPKPGNMNIANPTVTPAAPGKTIVSPPLMAAPQATTVGAVPTPTPTPASSPVNAAVPLVPVPAPPPPPAPVVVAAASATAVAPAVLAKVSLSGTVRLSSGFGDGAAATGAPMENVQVSAEGAQCSNTDGQGRYSCSVPAGWSGRVSLRRSNYRFSPSALSFQNLRVDAGQQDFAAIYDPR